MKPRFYSIMFGAKSMIWYWIFSMVSESWNILNWHHHLQIMYVMGFVVLALVLCMLYLIKQLD